MPLKIVILVLVLMPFADADTAFTVMTYNIHHGEGGDGRLDLGRISDVIRSGHPDIVCLQEVDKGCERTDRIDMPSELAKLAGMNVAFWPNLKFQGGDYGNATLTRFDIVESENIPLPYVDKGERRGCLRTRLRIGDRLVDVFNTHLDLLPEARVKQVAAIGERLRGDVPAVVAGDFNEAITGPAMAALTVRFLDTFAKNVDFTKSTLVGSDRRIDFILVSPDITTVSAYIVDTDLARMASDHLPVVAKCSLPPAPETAKDKGIQVEDERVEGAVVR